MPMRHSRSGILLTLCAALAVASACTSDAGTNAVAEVNPETFLTTDVETMKERTLRNFRMLKNI